MSNRSDAGAILEALQATVLARRSQTADKSYVASLNQAGTDAILKKVGEEAAEVLIAAKNADDEALVSELADLWFHLQVLMTHRDIGLEKLTAELARRMNRSGLDEKAARGGDQ